MLVAGLAAQKLWHKATKHDELRPTSIVVNHANQALLSGGPCASRPFWLIFHRSPPTSDRLLLLHVPRSQEGQRTPLAKARRECSQPYAPTTACSSSETGQGSA